LTSSIIAGAATRFGDFNNTYYYGQRASIQTSCYQTQLSATIMNPNEDETAVNATDRDVVIGGVRMRHYSPMSRLRRALNSRQPSLGNVAHYVCKFVRF